VTSERRNWEVCHLRRQKARQHINPADLWENFWDQPALTLSKLKGGAIGSNL
jgi:hypothetical protein